MQIKMRAEDSAAISAIPRRHQRGKPRVSLLFMAPAFLIIAIFLLGPALWALYVSFTNMALTGVGTVQWVGLQNFIHILHDSGFFNALSVSLLYLAFSALLGQALLGLLLALLMRQRNRIYKSVLGAIIIFAWVIPDVVAGFIWSAYLAGGPHSILAPGLLNMLMASLHLPKHAWLQEYPLVMIVIAHIWRGTAFSMLLYASALEGIPAELLEAASIDGAGMATRLYYVTLPLIKGAIATDLLLITLSTLSDFSLVFVLTGGNDPHTQLLAIYQYQQAFQFFQIGYGSAIALLIIVVGAMLALLYIRILRIEL
ncbi:sugar ABC transporter permease [Ktedonosporobacter rubrisoli]|uniref:Sugar ABC transporter permease n=1 Tax=Ktedonosporobacter rubrisoli TaxID=2509675 RepID=A0A4P6JPX1_KTERU|nr:sugar ABC transporter permease [Ktedonosporobacter rubrisoli]QBD77439.1 sugar ABC transporter permease [Ktedonosporobacter rubrisoli]